MKTLFLIFITIVLISCKTSLKTTQIDFDTIQQNELNSYEIEIKNLKN